MDRGAVLTQSGLEVAELELDPPGPGEALVRVEASGVCHTDLHIIQTGGWRHPLPVLLGHEGAGMVEAVGEGVLHVGPGDRVIVGWRSPCGACAWCLRGARQLCRTPPGPGPRMRLTDGAQVTGALQTGTLSTRTVVHGSALVPLTTALPPEQACLIGCAVATGVCSVLNTAAVWEGARVGVIGCGAVGLSVIQGARIAGAAEIHALDLDERKLEAAGRFGATHLGDAEAERLDFVFDVVGRGETVAQGLGMLGHAGHARLHRAAPAGLRGDRSAGAALRPAAAHPRLARRRPDPGGGLPAAGPVRGRRRARPGGNGDQDDRVGRRGARLRGHGGGRGHSFSRGAMKIPPPIAELLGMDRLTFGDGKCTMKMEAGEQHSNPMGTLHGGVLCDLADAAMGMAFFSTCAEGETFTTLELKINFLRPFWTGTLLAHGRVVQRGKTVGMTECDVVDENERLIAKATSTCLALRGDAAQGR